MNNYTDRQKELMIDLINKQLNTLKESIKYIEEEIKYNLTKVPHQDKLMEATILHTVGEHHIKLAEYVADKFNLESVLKTLI
jgi:hypothetical protein